MVIRGGKEVDNKVSDKKYDKEERPKTNESDHKIENDSSPSSIMSFPPLSHISLWFVTLRHWMHPSLVGRRAK